MEKDLTYYLVPQQHHDMCFDLLKHVISVLDFLKINYWADGGTLLGLYRHGGPIPWDDDIDLAVDEKGFKKICRNKHLFAPRWLNNPSSAQLNDIEYSDDEEDSNEFNNYIFCNMSEGLVKIITNEYTYIPPGELYWGTNRTLSRPCVDIFCYRESETEIHLANPVHLLQWPDATHYIEDFYPLMKMKYKKDSFDPKSPTINVNSPKNALGYLDRLYPGWKNTAIIATDHSSSGVSNSKIKFNLNNIKNEI